jgi:hypothetical protein
MASGALLLVLCASMAAASAGASGATTLTSCTFSALRTAVSAGGTIDYQQDCTDVPFTGSLTVGSGQTVDVEGNGHTVAFDGQFGHRLIADLNLHHRPLIR